VSLFWVKNRRFISIIKKQNTSFKNKIKIKRNKEWKNKFNYRKNSVWSIKDKKMTEEGFQDLICWSNDFDTCELIVFSSFWSISTDKKLVWVEQLRILIKILKEIKINFFLNSNKKLKEIDKKFWAFSNLFMKIVWSYNAVG